MSASALAWAGGLAARARGAGAIRPSLLLALLLASACHAEPAAQAREHAARLLAVESTVVRAREGYTVREYFAGRVTARRTSELGFERGARVVEMRADEGDRVCADQVLAHLDTRELEARRRELEARVAQGKARLALAQRTSRRRRALLERETLYRQAYDEALFEQRALQAELGAARAALESVGVALELSVLRAPYAGSVTRRYVDEGTPVAAGETVLQLVEDDYLELRVGLPPETAARAGAKSVWPAESHAGPFEAHLAARVPRVEPQTRTVPVVFEIREPPAALRPGDLARLMVETERPGPGFWLPLTALAESHRGLWSAFALRPADEDPDAHVVERRELQLVHAEAERVFVRGTLRDGERVVATGLHRVVPGQKVHLLP